MTVAQTLYAPAVGRPTAICVLAASVVAGCGGSAQSRSTARAAPATGGPPPPAISVAQALRARGLPVADVLSFTAANDPNHLLGRPGQYVSKVMFTDPRAGKPPPPDGDVESGGSVETFDSASDARSRADYIGQITKRIPAFVEYDVTRGRILLRLSGALTPQQVADYRAALATLTG